LRFFHDGQFEGRRKKVPVHLGRRAEEVPDPALLAFYEQLLGCLNLRAAREGSWSLLECAPAWDSNWTAECFICFAWDGSPQDRLVVAVNYAANQGQCYLRLPFGDISGRSVLLEDLMGSDAFERDGTQLSAKGLYLDMRPWGYHVFRLTTSAGS
jgi:hypothetical protein